MVAAKADAEKAAEEMTSLKKRAAKLDKELERRKSLGDEPPLAMELPFVGSLVLPQIKFT